MSQYVVSLRIDLQYLDGTLPVTCNTRTYRAKGYPSFKGVWQYGNFGYP
jgi:hypothetical protein